MSWHARRRVPPHPSQMWAPRGLRTAGAERHGGPRSAASRRVAGNPQVPSAASPSTRRISASAASPTSSCCGAGPRGCPPHAGSRAGRRNRRVNREFGWRSLQANTSTATAALPTPTATSAAGPRSPARRAATLPMARGREHRSHQVRAAAIVLLRRLGRRLAVLVGGDRLVLNAVVGRQLARRAGQQRRREAHEGHRRLAAHVAAARVRFLRAAARRPLARIAWPPSARRPSRRGSADPASAVAPGSARLTRITAIASASLHAAHPGTPSAALPPRSGLGPAPPDLARIVAHGRASRARARAARCAGPCAQAQLVVGHR